MPAAPFSAASTISAERSCSVSLEILASSSAASFLAVWYSAFSFRSPKSRATLIFSAFSRRPAPSRSGDLGLEALVGSGGHFGGVGHWGASRA
jgi:hypothetical protein